jgi:cytochrome bd-type quinol oxidase subunit 2
MIRIKKNIMRSHQFRKLVSRFSVVAVLGLSVVLPFGVRAVATCTNGTLMNGVCVPSGAVTGLPETEAGQVIVNIMYWLLGMLGLLAMVMFVVSGIMYLTAGGDEKNTEHAKNNIKYAIIGVAVALLGYTIVYTIQQVVTGDGTTGGAAGTIGTY